LLLLSFGASSVDPLLFFGTGLLDLLLLSFFPFLPLLVLLFLLPLLPPLLPEEVLLPLRFGDGLLRPLLMLL